MPRKQGKSKPQLKLPKPGTPERRKATWVAFEKVRTRANRGDQKARAALLRFMADNDLWGRFGGVADYAERSIVEAMTKGEWVGTQCIRHEVHEMRKRLLGPSPTVVEEMAVERILAAWLQLQHVQVRCAEPHRDLAWSKFWLRRLDLATAMHDAALRSLALVRKFLPSPVPSNAIETQAGEANGCLAAVKPCAASGARNGHGANRIAGLLGVTDVGGDGGGDPVPRRHNGTNRVAGLLGKTRRNGVAFSS